MMVPRSTPQRGATSAAQQPPPSSGRSPPPKAPSLPRRQPPHTPDELQFAKRTLQKLVQDSHFFPVHDKNNRVQTIRESEIDFGSVLGKGGFCEVRAASLKYSMLGHPRGPRTAGGGAVATPRYAMKYLSPSKTTSSRVFQRGIADLAMEACFLSLLRHENIIGLHYVSEGSLEENYNCAANGNNRNNGSHANRHGQQDEVVMDANGNLQLRRSPQQPVVQTNYHMFGYFLLLDPLHETLTDRIEKTCVPQILRLHNNSNNNTPNKIWDRIRHKNNNNNNTGNNKLYDDPNDPKVQLAQRLGMAKCIASALKYLHDDCHIIFRDIKPDNIGFYRRSHPHCSCGYHNNRSNNNAYSQSNSNTNRPSECTCYDEITKLFDFGLAKELKPKYRKSHPAYPDQDTYKLTGCTGSRRYMAPEVCFSDPYNEKADVYSFGMLLYQVASLVTPFDGFSMGKHEREVLRGGFRPDVKITSPSSSFTMKGKKSANNNSYTNMQEQQQAMVIEGGGAGSEQGNAEKKNQLLALKTKRYWPKELPRLMEECWDYDMRYRPEMKEVAYRLERCIEDLVVQGNKNSVLSGVAGHWPKFNPLNCAVTLETAPTSSHPMSSHPMSSHAFSQGGGFVDYSQAIVTSQQQEQQYQYAPMAPPAVVSNSNNNGKRRSSRRNENDIDSNISNQAVYQQQRRRSSSNNNGDEPTMMQWR